MLATAALFTLTATPAHAAQGYGFLEIFGSANEPTFAEQPVGMAVQQSNGDLYVIESRPATENGVLKRFNSDGTPHDFSALEGGTTNVIDGAGGAGEDETPAGEVFSNEGFPASEAQVAVAPPGAASGTAGNIYVTDAYNEVVDVFASSGEYLGQISGAGYTCGVAVASNGDVYLGDYYEGVHKLVPSAPATFTESPNSPFTTANRPCQVAAGAGPTEGFVFATEFNGIVTKIDGDGAEEGETKYTIASGFNMTVTVDPETGHVFRAEGSEVVEYDASGETEATQVARLEDAGSEVTGVAVEEGAERLYVAREGSEEVEVFEPVPLPEVTIGPASDVTGAKATLNGTVNPEGIAITECFFEYGKTTAYGSSAPCEGAIPTDSASHPVTAALSGLLANGATYHYRIVAKNADGQAASGDKTLLTANTFFTDPATGISDTEATLRGTVRLEGIALTDCKFQYGTSTSYGSSVPCSPLFSTIPNDDADHSVAAALSGLEPSTAYHFRLMATNAAGTILGADRSFTTAGPPGPPQIVEQRPLDVDQTSATLSARLNPSGHPTTYYFEFGTDPASYDTRIPADSDLFAGDGLFPVTVSTTLSGLQEASVYWFRVVATNSEGTAIGPDQRLETLNEHGLPNNRAFELVSPADKAPQGQVGSRLGSVFQVAEDGQSVVFPLLGGLADTDSGGDTAYLAKRSSSAWLSTKVSPPSMVPNPANGLIGTASTGTVSYYSPDLSCGIVYTFNPLTEDTPQADVELGTYNLYVRHDDGTYTLITDTVPSNPEIAGTNETGRLKATFVPGASEDCSRVYFESEYKYLPGASGLYEWDNGTLRDAGRLPNGATAVALGALKFFISSQSQSVANLNSVSPDGSRFSFKALSNESATAGRPAVFVREDSEKTNDPACQPPPSSSQCTVEVSKKQPGGTADSKGAAYETSSPDGSHVFFLANYGLTPASSSGPSEECANSSGTSGIGDLSFNLRACDLYDYDVDSGQLTDLSATTHPANTKGAVARGVLAVSEDGESVYFAARGQLIPGEGRTYAQNVAGPEAAQTANVYLARGGQLSYVGVITVGDWGFALLQGPGGSHVTPDGDHLLFQSRANVTGYDSGGVSEAYLYSADEDKTICISCRPDGEPSVGTSQTSPLISVHSSLGRLRAISDNGSRVFFTMPDVLAPGAVSGDQNIYQWEKGQISLLLSGSTALFGASPSGDDVFIRSAERLTPYDKDLVLDLYDFRVGGGFAPPPIPPPPCQVDESVPLLPGQIYCQGTPTPQPAAPSPASAGFQGPGNPPPCRKGTVRRGERCVSKLALARRACRKKHGRAKRRCIAKQVRRLNRIEQRQSRAANTDRGGAR